MKGARLFWQRPEYFFRDCAECREFCIDERTGRPKLGPDGEAIRLGEKQKAPCEACPKRDKETGAIWPGFTRHNGMVFEICRACIELGALPRPGGIEDQEPASLQTLLLLKAIKDDCDATASAEHEEALLTALVR